MRRWAARAERLIVLSESQDARAERLLGVPPEQCVEVTNGFDPERFQPREVDRGAHWARVRPGDWPATSGLASRPVYVGRFTEVKRVPLLIEAYEAARERFGERAPLVLVGGFPDEFEGEHPDEAIARTGAQDVHLAGWHEHDVLPELHQRRRCHRSGLGGRAVRPGAGRGDGLRAAGHCGRFPRPGGDRGRGGDRLARRPGRPRRRSPKRSSRRSTTPRSAAAAGANARQAALDRYAWPALAERVAAVYETALGRR